MARRRPTLPDWRRVLFWGGGIAFFGYWILFLHNDFQTLNRLKRDHRELSRALNLEHIRAQENAARLGALQRGEGWEDLIRKELRYIKEGEILVRPVVKRGTDKPQFRKVKIK